MSFLDFVAIVRRFWIVIIAIVLVTGALIACADFARPQSWTSTSSLLVTVRGSADTAYQNNLLATQLAGDIVVIGSSENALASAAHSISPSLDGDSIQRAVEISVPNATSIVSITATATTPQRAREIAVAVAQSTQARTTSLADSSGLHSVPVLSSISSGTVPALVSPKPVTDVLFGCAASLAVCLLLLLLRQRVQPRIWSKDSVVQAMGDASDAVVASGRPNDKVAAFLRPHVRYGIGRAFGATSGLEMPTVVVASPTGQLSKESLNVMRSSLAVGTEKWASDLRSGRTAASWALLDSPMEPAAADRAFMDDVYGIDPRGVRFISGEDALDSRPASVALVIMVLSTGCSLSQFKTYLHLFEDAELWPSIVWLER